jgi:hypothetical protein
VATATRPGLASAGRAHLAVLVAQLGVGGLLGIVAFRATMPSEALSRGADGFTVFLDQLGHLASLRYFAWDQWRWPLMLAGGLGRDGTIIVFNDANPFYALLLRVFHHWMQPEDNFIGIWLFIVYALQGLAAVAATRMWGVRSWVATMSATVLALSMQPWIVRVAHFQLSSHFVLLFAVGLYGWAGRAAHPLRPALFGMGLFWITIAINLYLSLMVLSLVIALMGRQWVARLRRLAPTCGLIGMMLAGAFAEMWAMGFFRPHGIGRGFEIYSMNLLSPVYPIYSRLLDEYVRPIDATTGQHEGFNFLGLGLLIALGAAWPLWRSRAGGMVARHWPLLGILAALGLFSLSTKVYVGPHVLIDLPEPPDVISQFRAPGRFFWPIAYTLLVGAVTTLAGARRWRLSLLLVACAVLQAYDAGALRTSVRVTLARPSAIRLDKAAWLPVIEDHRAIEVQPTFDCLPVGLRQEAIATVVYFASISRTPVNTTYSARPLPPDCGKERAATEGWPGLERGTLLVLLDDPENPATPPRTQPRGWTCATFSLGRACSTSEHAAHLAGLGSVTQ